MRTPTRLAPATTTSQWRRSCANATRSRHTSRAYTAELQRLVQWCQACGRGPLSDLTRQDLLMYQASLRGAPSALSPSEGNGAAFAALSERSQSRALAVTASLFRYWHDTGYSLGNPAVGLAIAQATGISTKLRRPLGMDLLLFKHRAGKCRRRRRSRAPRSPLRSRSPYKVPSMVGTPACLRKNDITSWPVAKISRRHRDCRVANSRAWIAQVLSDEFGEQTDVQPKGQTAVALDRITGFTIDAASGKRLASSVDPLGGVRSLGRRPCPAADLYQSRTSSSFASAFASPRTCAPHLGAMVWWSAHDYSCIVSCRWSERWRIPR